MADAALITKQPAPAKARAHPAAGSAPVKQAAAPAAASAAVEQTNPLAPALTNLGQFLGVLGNNGVLQVLSGGRVQSPLAPDGTLAKRPPAKPAEAGAAAAPKAAGRVPAASPGNAAAPQAAAAGELADSPSIDKVVDELIADYGIRAIHGVLKAEADRGRLNAVVDRYQRRTKATFRDWLIGAYKHLGQSRPREFVGAMALLHGGAHAEDEPWAVMGLALIGPGTGDATLLTLLTENKLPQRRALKETYELAFRGIGLTPHDTLAEHIDMDLGDLADSRYERQRALSLLDHELTEAEHISLLTTAIVGAHDAPALAILQRVWRRGPDDFAQLHRDWDRYVKGPGYTKLSLEAAMDDELDGVEHGAAAQIFAAYAARNDINYQRSLDLYAATNTIGVGLQAGVFSSYGGIVADAARDLRVALDKRAQRDPASARSAEEQRAQTDKQLVRHGGLSALDELESRLQLRRELTYADRVYLASRRREFAKVVALTVDAWRAHQEGGLERELRHPPAGDLRPAIAVNDQVIPADWTDFQVYSALTDPQLTHDERGAVRLQLALGSLGNTSAAANLETAYYFLRDIKDDALRVRVIASYVERYLDDKGKGRGKGKLVEDSAAPRSRDPLVRFANAVQYAATGFEESPALIDLLVLLKPKATLADVLPLAERREKSTRSGSFLTREIYDPLTAEHTVATADAALRRLRRWASLERVNRQELEAVMRAEGVTEASALATRGYAQLVTRLDEVRSVNKSIAAAVAGFVEFTSRSLLVAVLGPAALPGLIAAFGSFTAGIATQELLGGVDFQADTVDSLAKFVSEAASVSFKGLGLETFIKEAVPARSALLGTTGLSPLQHKYATEYLNAAGAKLFEQVADNMIRDPRFPTAAQMGSRAAQFATVAALKTGTSARLPKPVIYATTFERFKDTLHRVILNGPPPQAAIGYVLTKEMTDMLSSGAWDDTTLAEKLSRMSKRAAISIASAMPVAAALTSLGRAEANALLDLGAKDPEAFYNALKLQDPMFSRALPNQ